MRYGTNTLYIKYSNVIGVSVDIRKQVKVKYIVRFFYSGVESGHNNPSTKTFLPSKESLSMHLHTIFQLYRGAEYVY